MEKIISDLKKLPKFRLIDKKNGLAECRSFRIRWLQCNDGQHWDIQLGQKKTFDRWANSDDFADSLRSYKVGCYRSDLQEVHKWMEKVCRSGLFDFDNYI